MDREIQNFYELDAWRKSHRLALAVYHTTNTFPAHEQFGIVSQLRRAASSVTANIAEGFERYHFKDKIRFYYQARGPLAEVQNFIILARDLGLIDTTVFHGIDQNASEARRLVNGLIRSVEKQRVKQPT